MKTACNIWIRTLFTTAVMPAIFLMLLTASSGLAAGSITAAKLRSEYKFDPVGIDAAKPRLSWILEASNPAQRGLKQSAYQIVVADSAEALQQGQGNLWDSGKVSSGNSVNIEYAGKELASEQDCFWKVRVWDQEGQACEWSANARWTMGLLKKGDWKGQWIGFDGDATSEDPQARKMKELLTFKDCQWIWTTGAKAGNQPAGSAYFRKLIDVPADRKVVQAQFLIAADDGFSVSLNGHVGGQGSSWKTPTAVDITGRVQPGKNALGIKVTNGGNTPSPAGVLGKLVILFESGEPMVVPVDASWKCSRKEGDRWNWADFDDASWTPATAIAKYGAQPWGEVKISEVKMLPAPYLRKGFTVSKPLKRAVLFASGLGVYELHLNGKPLNNDVLSPGWSDYRKRVHYFGYDITRQLKQGDNALGAILGDGWYAGYLCFTGKRNYYGNDTRFLAHLRLDYADGTSEVVGTDSSWKAAYGAVRGGGFADGLRV